MAEVGEITKLPVCRESAIGVFLDAGELGEVLLPKNELPYDRRQGTEGEEFEVFLYRDSEDRPIATLSRPTLLLGGIGVLNVVSATKIGCFLDWGLPKDLLLPFREQRGRPQEGCKVVVAVKKDLSSDRIIATQRVEKFLGQEAPQYDIGQEVDLIIFGQTDLGFKAVVNGTHNGLLFASETFREFRIGDQTNAYIKDVREDWKIDLSLTLPGAAGVESVEEKILAELSSRGGFWDLHDRSPAEEIYRELSISKKLFKKATGSLYRQRKITLESDGIRLARQNDS
ncbi:MAG: S1 RNA-binding domain-containing protein [Akkermansiaceae bacterium]